MLKIYFLGTCCCRSKKCCHFNWHYFGIVVYGIVFIFTFSAFYKTSGSSLGSSGSVFEIQKQNLIKNFVFGTRFCDAWFPDTIFSSIQFLYFGFYIPLHRVLICILYFSEHPPLRVLNRGSLIPLFRTVWAWPQRTTYHQSKYNIKLIILI